MEDIDNRIGQVEQNQLIQMQGILKCSVGGEKITNDDLFLAWQNTPLILTPGKKRKLDLPV